MFESNELRYSEINEAIMVMAADVQLGRAVSILKNEWNFVQRL